MRKLLISMIVVFPLYGFMPTHWIGFFGSKDPTQRTSNYPLISGDMFRAACDHVFDETCKNFKLYAVQYGDTIFVNGNLLYQFISRIHPHLRQPYILVTHNSDRSIPDYFYDFLEDPKLLFWFGINTMILNHHKMKVLPIGVENDSFGKTKIIQELLLDIPAWQDRENKAYVNFSIRTNVLLRGFVWQLFKDQPYCVNDSDKPYREYLEQMKQHRFVISPAGYGIDCHRHWEALLMGAIPIIQHSTIDELFEGLPVILVHDWMHVNPTFLQIEYERLCTTSFNYNKLYADYWLNEIKQKQNQVRSLVACA